MYCGSDYAVELNRMAKVLESTVRGDRWRCFAMSPGTRENPLNCEGVVFEGGDLCFDDVEAICARFGVLAPDWSIEDRPKFFCDTPKRNALVLCVRRWAGGSVVAA